jgi:crossover junction endodeoxyribonuclease RuvC
VQFDGPRVAQIVDAGVITSRADRSLPERLGEIAGGLDDVLDEHQPGLLGVEQLYAHYKHPRTAIIMGHVRGVLLLGAARRGIAVLNLPATHIKRALTGNGRASKPQMQRAVMSSLRLARPPEPADVADAIAVALAVGLHETARR